MGKERDSHFRVNNLSCHVYRQLSLLVQLLWKSEFLFVRLRFIDYTRTTERALSWILVNSVELEGECLSHPIASMKAASNVIQ